MRHLLACLALSTTLAGGAVAEEQPVVVELFTSQGCSSCPPADRLMKEMADNDAVLPLALHVDYWDYIGWADSFADPLFTKRQKAYAHAGGERMIYTPQVIVGGKARVVGSRAMQVVDAVMTEKDSSQPVRIETRRTGGKVEITARLADGAAPRDMVVQLVTYSPHERVEIHGGENAGKVVDYINVVRDWRVLGDWDGAGTWTGEVEVDGKAAVIVQVPGPGAILGAARVD